MTIMLYDTSALIFLSTLSLRRATVNEDRYGQQFWRFLSTLSLRRATRVLEVTRNAHTDFYPRSPCGERQYLVRGQRPSWEISIHALLAESDLLSLLLLLISSLFLSTLSLRRATNARPEIRRRDAISIHALLAESDAVTTLGAGSVRDFYPRSPCGERRR